MQPGTPGRRKIRRGGALAMAALASVLGANDAASAGKSGTPSQAPKPDYEKRLEIGRELNELLAKDPQAFIERAKQYGNQVSFIILMNAEYKAPLLVLDNLDHFKLELGQEILVINTLIKSMDIISAANWLGAHPEKLARMKKYVDSLPKNSTQSFRKPQYEEISRFPSPAAAQLMLAFYLKHGGRAMRWADTFERVQDFETAANLLEKYPVIAQHAIKADPGVDNRSLTNVIERMANNELVEKKTGKKRGNQKEIEEEAKKISEMTLGWAQKFSAKNPLILAKYAVLVTRDLAMRGIKTDSTEEVQKSIARIEAGQNEARKLDPLKNRDLFVFISGDNVIEKRWKTEYKDVPDEVLSFPLPYLFKILSRPQVPHLTSEVQRVHELHDRNSAELYERYWKEKNPSGYKMETLAVPFAENGDVTDADLKSTREKFLAYLGSGGNPRTVIIETHGAKKLISLHKDPMKEPGVSGITVKEFVAAHKKRLQDPEVARNYAAGKRDVYLFTQCLPSDYALNVFASLREEKVPGPVIVGGAETGASAQFVPPDQLAGGRADITREIAKRADKGLEKVVDQALTFTQDGIDSPITIFIPDEQELPLQVTEQLAADKSTDRA